MEVFLWWMIKIDKILWQIYWFTEYRKEELILLLFMCVFFLGIMKVLRNAKVVIIDKKLCKALLKLIEK